MAEWKAGTPVAIVRREEDFFLVEGKGIRAWVEGKYLTIDGKETEWTEAVDGE